MSTHHTSAPATPPNSPALNPVMMAPGPQSQLSGFYLGAASNLVIDLSTGKIYGFDKNGRKFLDKSVPATKFQLFSGLPKEVRCKIWVHAAEDEARLIVLTEKPQFLGSFNTFYPNGVAAQTTAFRSFFRMRADRRPRVAMTSHEAFEVLTKTGIYKPSLGAIGFPKRAYFNANSDTIRLCADTMGISGRVPQLTLSQGIGGIDLRNLTRLEFPWKTFVKFSSWAGNNVKELFNLRKMILSCISYDWVRYAAHPFELNLAFEPQWAPVFESENNYTIDFEMIPWCVRSDGLRLAGMAVMYAVFPYLLDGHCRAELMDKWGDISRIANTCFEMPDTVLKITYIPGNLAHFQ